MRSPEEFKDHPYEPFWGFRAICKHVVDGDTYDFLVDLGFNSYQYVTVRLRDVDTPEIFRPKTEEERDLGFLAKAFVEERILNKPVMLFTSKDVTFGRYVAEVFYTDGEGVYTSVGHELRKAGFIKD